MKRILCVLLVWMNGFLCLNAAHGQGKFSMSITGTPFYRYARTERSTYFPWLNGGSAIPVDIHVRQSGVGYSLGAMVRYSLSTQWSVSSGVWFNHIAYKQPTISTSPSQTVLFTDTRSRNFQVPLLANCELSSKRISPYFSGGVVLSLPSNVIWPDGSTFKNADKRVRLYPTLGAGVLYHLSADASLIAQPSLTYILPIGNYTTYKNYQFGFQA